MCGRREVLDEITSEERAGGRNESSPPKSGNLQFGLVNKWCDESQPYSREL